MKLPMADKKSLKIIIIVALLNTIAVTGIILLFQLGFGKCFLVAIWDIGGARYFVLSLIFILYPLAIIECMLNFSHVTIDEKCVIKWLGKIMLCNYKWDDIKRIELRIYGKGRFAHPYIIFSKTDKPNFFLAHNINLPYVRKHLVCLYKQGALDLLIKYANCPIHGIENLNIEEDEVEK